MAHHFLQATSIWHIFLYQIIKRYLRNEVEFVNIGLHNIDLQHKSQQFLFRLRFVLNLFVRLLKDEDSSIAREDWLWDSIVVNFILEVYSV